MDFVKINCRYGDIDSAASFNILHDILSGPLALLGLTAFSSFIWPSVDIFRLGISGVPLSSICGKLSRSSFVNTDLNCSFNAFPLLFSIVSPFTFSVDTPTVSLFLDFTYFQYFSLFDSYLVG